MINGKKIGVVFGKNNEKIIPSISIEDVDEMPENINVLLKNAADLYNDSILKMKLIVSENIKLRKSKKQVPARLMWNFGNEIFNLIDKLGEINFRFDNLYQSLIRDLSVSDTTLERVITFRRYTNDPSLIPANINWGKLKGSPKKYLNGIINK